MPTKRRVGRAQRGNAPAWMVRYFEDGTVPEKGTEAYQQYCDWTLFPGHSEFFGLGWPDPPEGTFPHWPPK